VNTVAPGPIATPIFGRMGLPDGADVQIQEDLASNVPIKRLGEAREVADAVVFLASDESSYIVGVELAVDGGQTQL